MRGQVLRDVKVRMGVRDEDSCKSTRRVKKTRMRYHESTQKNWREQRQGRAVRHSQMLLHSTGLSTHDRYEGITLRDYAIGRTRIFRRCALVLACLLALVGFHPTERSYAEPSGTTVSAHRYTLSFTLERPEFSDLEYPNAVYSNYWMRQPRGNGVWDPDEWNLLDFSVNYSLAAASLSEPQVQKLSYSSADYAWSHGGAMEFSNISIPHKTVQVEYYAPEGKTWFEPYLLAYSLKLEDAGDHMVLKVPRLEPRDVDTATGEEKVLKVSNILVTERVLYIDAARGSDSNDGLSESAPVKSFARAKELAAADSSIERIVVLSTIPVSGEISLAGTSAKLVRGKNFTGHLLEVAAGTSATLTNITVDGGSQPAGADGNRAAGTDPVAKRSLISVSGDLTIAEGTVLENNRIKHDPNSRSYGGAVNASGSSNKPASITMTAGIIRNNLATDGGGIYLRKSTLTMSSGSIENNTAEPMFDSDVSQYYGSGGGILADDGSTVNLSGDALIKGNSAGETGGGISVGAVDWADNNITLNMAGGTIDSNSAGSAGGGIFVQTGARGAVHTANISAGYITNNEMTGQGSTEKEFGGGGIYVNGAPDGMYNMTWRLGQLNLTNALITQNTSEYEGAGLAACPVSETNIHLSAGSAIYGNTASKVSSWYAPGSEPINEVFFYTNKHYGMHSGKAKYEVSPTMLGGVPYNWQDSATGTDLAADKYKGTLEPREGGSTGYLGLNTTAVASDRTKVLAKVFITGNRSATRGGGIGSNGAQTHGNDEPIIDIPVVKKWQDTDNADGSRPKTITLRLFSDGEDAKYSLELSEANEWKGSFLALPKQKTVTDADGNESKVDIVYTVKEDSVAGYETEVTGTPAEGITVTNTHKPPTPPTPPAPSESTPPAPPTPTPDKPKLAHTGFDVTDGILGMFFGMLGLGGAVLGLRYRLERKR